MKLPQLTLRDLFWLVLVIGLALGWWLDHRAASQEAWKEEALLWQEQAEDLASYLRAKGYEVSWDEFCGAYSVQDRRD